jgi:fatty acid desaturase
MTVCSTIITGFDPYRTSHFAHHRGANTKKDPDVGFVETFYKLPRWRAVLAFASTLTGLLFLFAVYRYIARNWRQNWTNVIVVLALIAMLLIGWSANFYPAVVAIMYWFVPLATWGVFTNLVRSLAEHYPENEFQRGAEFPHVFRTRDVLNSWFDSCFIVTRGVNFHLTHHLCPQVPFYRLPELQRELSKSHVYRQYAHVTHGYHRFLCEYFFQRDKPMGFLTAGGDA